MSITGPGSVDWQGRPSLQLSSGKTVRFELGGSKLDMWHIHTYTTEHVVCSEKSNVDSNSVKLRCTNITQLQLCCHGEWNWNSFSTFTLHVWPASHEWKALPCHAWGWRQSPLRTPRTFLCSLHGYKRVQRDGTSRINIAGITFIHWSSEQFLRQCCLRCRHSGHEGILDVALLCWVCDWLVLGVWRHGVSPDATNQLFPNLDTPRLVNSPGIGPSPQSKQGTIRCTIAKNLNTDVAKKGVPFTNVFGSIKCAGACRILSPLAHLLLAASGGHFLQAELSGLSTKTEGFRKGFGSQRRIV